MTTPAPHPADVRDRLDDIAARVCDMAGQLGLDQLADELAQDTRRRLRADQARVLVLGEIKQGKSTLINALLGAEALPMGVTPTTGATVVVRAGKPAGTFEVRPDGTRGVLERDEFVRRAKGPNPGGGPAAKGQLELVVAGEHIPTGLEIVDTPGINDIASYRAAISRGELPRADVLVLVLDATQLLNRTELAFLRDALSAVGGLDDSGARLLLVVNRIDLVAEDDRPKLRDYLRRELSHLAAGRENSVETFETNARAALREPNSQSHGVVEVRRLRERLYALAGTRKEVLPARVRASLLRHTVLLAHNAAILAHAIGLEQETLRREIRNFEIEWKERELDMSEVRTQMAAGRERLLGASDGRVSQFREQLQASTAAAITVANQRMLASHLPGALHDAFLAFAHEESERLRGTLEELTRQAIHTHSAAVQRRLNQATMRFGFRGPTIYLDPPSVVLEAGLVAVGVVGTAVMYFGNMVTGMLMTVVGPLATMALREKSLAEARTRARAELPGALERADGALREGIRRVVDGHIAALDEHLVLANKALGDQLLAVLHTAEQALGGGGEAPGEVARARDEAAKRVATVENGLRALRSELEALGLSEADHTAP